MYTREGQLLFLLIGVTLIVGGLIGYFLVSLARQFEMQMKVLTSADANDRAATQILSSR